MRVLRKIMAITLALTLVLSMGAMTAMAVENPPETITVTNETELKAAVARGAKPATVVLKNDIKLTKPLIVEAEVTIDGGEKKFKVNASNMTEGFEWQGEGKKFHGIIVANTNATLKNLTISGASGTVTENQKSGFGIQIKNVEKSDVTLTLDNVTIEGTKNGGGLLVNEKETKVIVKDCTFENNAWGGIEVVPGGVLTVDDTTFTGTGKPAIWIDRPLADVGAENIAKITGNSVTNKLHPKAIGEQVLFVELPSITLTGIGEGGNNTITTSELLPVNASGVVTVDDEHPLPTGQVSTLALTPNGYTDNILFKISVVDAEKADAKENLQFIAFDETMKMYLDALITEWGPPNTGFVPMERSTNFNIVADKAGTYAVTIEMVAMPGEAPVLVTEPFTLVVKEDAPVNPDAADKEAVAAAKAAIEAANYDIAQADANTEEAVAAEVKSVIEGLGLSNVEIDPITVTPFIPAVAGTEEDHDGTNGSFKVIAMVSKGSISDKAIKENVVITATEFIEEPIEPEKVDKTVLKKAITEAEIFHDTVTVSTDGTDVSTDKKWAQEADEKAFRAAIRSAIDVRDSEVATKVQVDTAVSDLADATTAFGKKISNGTKPVEPGDIAVTSVTVSPATLKLAIGVSGVTTGELTATVTPDNATNKTVVWTSGKATVASVDENGVVTAVAAGTTTITATAGGKSGTATIIVTDAETDKPEKPDPETPSGGGGGGESAPPPSQNTANDPETTEKVNDTVAALADPTKELPKDAVKTTTAGGASITTIPLKLSTGNATLGSGIFNTIGGAPATVGLKLTVSNGMSGGSAEIIIPGGFGKITEPGRFGYTMDYKNIAENDSKMIGAVKGDNAVSMTAKVGGNFTLPGTATVTVPTKLANGSNLNIYKYDPITNTFTVIGKAVVKDGKVTFATKMMGEILFTTGTL